jgi:pimeloyl-ACP methyl ester carboxylesterase
MTALAAIAGVLGLLGLVLGGLALFTLWTAWQIEKALPPLGRFIDIDGARIHYLDRGSGLPLLCIHGLAGQMRNFTYALLGALQSDFRVVILDRPGSGYSTRPAGASAALGAQAATIARFIDKLGLERPLVVGHSLGGAIALALAVDHPEKVGGLALLAPVTCSPQHVPPPFQGLAIASPLLRRLVAWTVAIPLAIMTRDIALDTLFGPQPVPADFATRGGALLSLRPQSFIGASEDLVAAMAEAELNTLPARYHDLTMPVGVIYGTGDRVLDPTAHSDALVANLPAVTFEQIEGGGHMILIASAERCAAFITRMARRVAGPPPVAPVLTTERLPLGANSPPSAAS